MRILRLITLFVAFLTLLAFIPVAKAETYVGVHTVSKHLDRSAPQGSKKAYNEVNPGVFVGYRYESETGIFYGPQLGTYKNSYNNQTTYLAVDFKVPVTGNFRVGALAGIANGYAGNATYGEFGAVFVPQAEYDIGKTRVIVSYMPKLGASSGSSAVALSFAWRF